MSDRQRRAGQIQGQNRLQGRVQQVGQRMALHIMVQPARTGHRAPQGMEHHVARPGPGADQLGYGRQTYPAPGQIGHGPAFHAMKIRRLGRLGQRPQGGVAQARRTLHQSVDDQFVGPPHTPLDHLARGRIKAEILDLHRAHRKRALEPGPGPPRQAAQQGRRAQTLEKHSPRHPHHRRLPRIRPRRADFPRRSAPRLPGSSFRTISA